MTAPDAAPLDVATQDARMDADEIPCAPRAVLQTICQQCHTTPLQNGAPFPLVNRSDILAVRSGTVIRELMIQQLEAERMPLAPVTITAEERQTLLDWLYDGAPAVSPRQCPDTPEDAGTDADASEPEDAGMDASDELDANDGAADD